jgi:hypothetical protein
MPSGTMHISSAPPAAPPTADFALLIDFRKGQGHPQRIFQAADAMIRALQRLDRVLCTSVDSNLEPELLLEDVEAGSLRIWLRNALTVTDDEALKTLDWRPAIGKYLVRAKYVYIEWANEKDPTKGSLIGLAKEIARIASETDVRHLPAYSPPSVAELASVSSSINAAKAFLTEGDSISFEPTGAEPIAFDLTVSRSPEELIDLSIKEKVLFPAAPMRLIVRKPDYLGNSKWEFRHGKRFIPMKIEDEVWLQKFQARQVDVRPGDSLHCNVVIENSYGYDNELIREAYTVVKVLGVIEKNSQADFIDPPG